MAWSGSSICIGKQPDARDAFASEQISVTTAGVSTLTAATYNPSQNTESGAGVTGINMPATAALFSVETTASRGVNFTIDGTTPTTGATGVGHPSQTADNFIIFGLNNLRNFKMIGISATTLVYVTYLR